MVTKVVKVCSKILYDCEGASGDFHLVFQKKKVVLMILLMFKLKLFLL
jgi:hypothetical protein